MASAETAAVAALVIVALNAGHWIGDHSAQTSAQALNKVPPPDAALTRGAHPWRGWSWCAKHVAVYTLCQAIAIAVAGIVAPLSGPGITAALAISASTHAVIDRRWLVQVIVKLKKATGWDDGPYLVDQSLHHAAMLFAGVAAAAVTTVTGAVVVIVVGAAMIGADLATEHWRAARLRRTPVELPVAVLATRTNRAA